MMTLYELTEKYQSLRAYLEEQEDADPDMLLQALALVEGDIVDKIEHIARYVISLQADATAIESEQTRLQSRRKAVDSKVAWLKDYIVGQMQIAKLEKVQKAIFTVALRRSPPSVQILDEARIPEQYKIVETSTRVDRKAILESYKMDGEIVPGTCVQADKKYLHIS